jgi:hypothetical protein
MMQQSLRFALLLAFASAMVSCALVQPEAGKKGTRQAGRPPQTGTNIPRLAARTSKKSEKRDKKQKAAKATPTPKPKRERPKAAEKVDEDFVTRGGFR